LAVSSEAAFLAIDPGRKKYLHSRRPGSVELNLSEQ
jgi:hypothetical protein